MSRLVDARPPPRRGRAPSAENKISVRYTHAATLTRDTSRQTKGNSWKGLFTSARFVHATEARRRFLHCCRSLVVLWMLDHTGVNGTLV